MKGYDRNDFKLSFIGEPKFYVNKEKGTVACEVTTRLKTPLPVSGWGFPSVEWQYFIGKAVAKCANGDAFDENRGKRIAISRAENDAYLKAANYLTRVGKRLDEMSSAIDGFIDKAYRCCGHNEDFIDSLSYEAHPHYEKEVYAPKYSKTIYSESKKKCNTLEH